MCESSDSEEFFDAEDVTPSKQSKKPNSEVTIESTSSVKDISYINEQILQTEPLEIVLPSENAEDEGTTIKNVVQGRKRFRELRKYMQTDDEDGVPTTNSTPDSQTSSVEGVFATAPKSTHPFRIIEHDTLSLQSMTSLGRIGKILSGSMDPTAPTGMQRDMQTASKEPSITSDEKIHLAVLPVLAMQEPDVIASTKANSLKHSRTLDSSQSIMTISNSSSSYNQIGNESCPIAPPRRKKKGKIGTSLPTDSMDECQASVAGREDEKLHLPRVDRMERPPPLQELDVGGTLSDILNSNLNMPLPSPASTIESITRELQHSLDMNQSDLLSKQVSRIKASDTSLYDKKLSNEKLNRSGSSSRSSTGTSVQSHQSSTVTAISQQNCLDIRAALKGQYVVKPQDEEKLKAMGAPLNEPSRTHSEDRAILPTPTGHSSLGSSNRTSDDSNGKRGRRRSAGDSEALARREMQQLNMLLRTRTDSGKQLTEMEILEQVTVLNLDTGERVPLSVAEEKLPKCVNPLCLHIMRITSEYIGSRHQDDENARDTDEESERGTVSTRHSHLSSEAGRELVQGSSDGTQDEQMPGGLRKKTEKLKRFLGSTVKKTMIAAKSLAQEVTHGRHKEDVADIIDDVRGDQNIKLKASNSHKGPFDFDGCVRHVQEMSNGHTGAVWCMKFSVCGRLLATAGQDKLLHIWVLRDALHFFQDMRTKYNAEQKSSPTPSQESLASLTAPPAVPEERPICGPMAPFCPKPFCTYSGHTSDLLDVSWSKNYFVLSSSMDKTVRLWHISRGECLCCFQHIDFVTAIAFHPRDDRYFLSGSLDGKLRLWNIPDKKVAVWNEVDGQTKLITAANFCQNGKFAVVGTYDGRCIFYTTDQLKYHTQIDVRSSRGKNSTGRKISGIEPMPGEDKILVTSNDSRIRLYDLRDLNVSCKYKGYVNVSSQIKASFSHDGKYIVSGSENQCIYIWKTHHDYSKFSSVRRDRNDFWEGIKAHNAVVTCAVFAPNPDNIIKMIDEREEEARNDAASKEDEDKNPDKEQQPMPRTHYGGNVLLSADFNGCIKVFVNKTKPKHSSLPASALS